MNFSDAFLNTGKPVFHIEYASEATNSLYLNGTTEGSTFSRVVKKQTLDRWVAYCDGIKYNEYTLVVWHGE
jgi:hypothetical protein